jgi:hypothetical protein
MKLQPDRYVCMQHLKPDVNLCKSLVNLGLWTKTLVQLVYKICFLKTPVT